MGGADEMEEGVERAFVKVKVEPKKGRIVELPEQATKADDPSNEDRSRPAPLAGAALGRSRYEAIVAFYEAKGRVVEQVRALDQLARDLGLDWLHGPHDGPTILAAFERVNPSGIGGALAVAAQHLWDEGDADAALALARASLDGWHDDGESRAELRSIRSGIERERERERERAPHGARRRSTVKAARS